MEWYNITLIVLAVLGIRIGLHFWDKQNIRVTAEAKGWRNITILWAPFAPGWFFEKGERHYTVRYSDKDDRWHEIYCKTSVLTGVYWRDENS